MKKTFSILLMLLCLQCFSKRSESMKIYFKNFGALNSFLKTYSDDKGRVIDYEYSSKEKTYIIWLHNDDDDSTSAASKRFCHSKGLYNYLNQVDSVHNHLPGRNGNDYIELYYEVAEVPESNYFEYNNIFYQNATLTEAKTGLLNGKDLYTKEEIINF